MPRDRLPATQELQPKAACSTAMAHASCRRQRPAVPVTGSPADLAPRTRAVRFYLATYCAKGCASARAALTAVLAASALLRRVCTLSSHQGSRLRQRPDGLTTARVPSSKLGCHAGGVLRRRLHVHDDGLARPARGVHGCRQVRCSCVHPPLSKSGPQHMWSKARKAALECVYFTALTQVIVREHGTFVSVSAAAASWRV